MKFLKTTIAGGLVFLVPLVVLVFVINEAMGVVLIVANPMAAFFGLETIGGIALANIFAVLIIILVCFVAGLVARSGSARKMTNTLESAVLQRVPGYTFLKGLAHTLSPEENVDLKPALISFGSVERIGLEVERVADDRVVVFFPGSPNAFSGITQIVHTANVKPIDAPIMDIIQCAEQMGRGTGQLLIQNRQDPA